MRLAGGSDDLVGGIAAALLADASTARQRLAGQVHQADRATADAYLAAIAQGDAETLARSMTNDSRTALRLPPTAALWTP